MRDGGRAPLLADDTLDELLAPLVALCDQLRLVGVTNRTRLRAALQQYERGEVEHAIGMLTSQLLLGVPIRSPVGLLVRLAEQHDPTYFCGAATKAPSGRSGEPELSGIEGLIEPGVPDLVIAPEVRAVLDAEIAASFAPLPSSVRERLLADQDGIHRLRYALLAEMPSDR